MRKKKIDEICNPDNYTTKFIGFDSETVTREELLAWHKLWEPRGSGDLGGMRNALICIHLVCKMRGFEPLTYEEIANYSYKDAKTFLDSINERAKLRVSG